LERVEKYQGSKDVFEEYRIGEQIAKALDRKVFLPSGGSLVIDRTEAMTVVDVNTGKFVGSGGNLEETVTKNNLESAEEIVRQLRLRDIGGIIVVDFIDMVLESNRDLVLRRLMECLSRDRTKHQVAEVTSLGLVQMTRKKLGLGLLETFSEACEACAGRGIVVHNEPHMRAKSGNDVFGQAEQRSKPDKNSGGNSNSKRNRGQRQEAPKVVTPERAVEINNVVAQIAASTIAAHEAAGEESIISLSSSGSDSSGKNLDAVLGALPEATPPGQGRKKSRRVTAEVIPTAESQENI
jgi:ribonuclease E